MKFLIPVFIALILASCEKAELPKPYSLTGESNTVSVSMGSDYGDQLFFQLSTASVIRVVDRSSWDLGFGTDAAGTMIVLNSAKHMSLAKTNHTELTAVTSASNMEWIYDNQKGMTDSLALSGWELNKVYLLDRGVTPAGSAIGKVKFRITAHDADSYTIEWGKLTATTFNISVIQKDPQQNFTHYSMNVTGSVVAVEPQKNLWDLAFTSYSYVYPDGTPYLVTGVLSNRNEVRVFEAAETFENVDLADAVGYAYSADLDIIGFDWKTYSFDTATYIIDFTKVYVVKSVDGMYYKLRFLDFYDENGQKGTPNFELVRLVS